MKPFTKALIALIIGGLFMIVGSILVPYGIYTYQWPETLYPIAMFLDLLGITLSLFFIYDKEPL